MAITHEGRGRATEGYFGELSRRTYTQLVTFRRNGEPVGTPVHLAAPPDGERAYFRTWHTTGKAKRMRRNSHVELAPSNFKGTPVGPARGATARLLEGEDAAEAARLLAARHPVLHGVLIPRYHRLRGWRTLHYEVTPAPGTQGDPTGCVAGSARPQGDSREP